MPRSKTRSGRAYNKVNNVVVKRKTRKTRSNKGVKRGPRRSKTRSGRAYNKPSNAVVKRKTRKTRSNKGVKRGPYGKRSGRTRSGRKFKA